MKMEHKIMIAGVWAIVLITICIISGIMEIKKLDNCENLRIRTFYKEDFTWNGVIKEVQEGKYQPKCL